MDHVAHAENEKITGPRVWVGLVYSPMRVGGALFTVPQVLRMFLEATLRTKG